MNGAFALRGRLIMAVHWRYFTHSSVITWNSLSFPLV